eukprot:m51a1_g5758 hypothetical protein (454) ;mRNA; f:1210045-1211406
MAASSWAAPATCYPNATLTEQYPPALIANDPLSGFAALNKLALRVKRYAVVGRVYGTMSIGPDPTAASGGCTLTVSGSPTTGAQPCEEDLTTSQFSWGANNLICGMTLDQTNATLDVWTGALRIRWTDSFPLFLDGVNFTRASYQDLLFRVELLRSVSVTPTNVVVYDSLVAHGVVGGVSLTFDSTTNYTSVALSIIMGVQKPFRPTTSAEQLFTSGTGTNTIVVHAAAPTQALVSTTSHNWKQLNYDITPDRSLKMFNGHQIFFSIGVDCDPGTISNPADCPLRAWDRLNVSITLTTADWTPKLVAVVTTTATLQTYGTSGYTATKSAFIMGDTVYAKATFTADDIGIVGAILQGVKINGKSVVNTTGAWDSVLLTSKFSFVLQASVLDDNVTESSMNVQVVASFDVVYVPYHSKRSAFQQHESIDVERTITVSPAVFEPGAASSLAPWSWF